VTTSKNYTLTQPKYLLIEKVATGETHTVSEINAARRVKELNDFWGVGKYRIKTED